MSTPIPAPSRNKVNKLFMKLLLETARGNKERVFEIAQRLLAEFEKDLDEGEHGSGSGS